MHAMTGVVGAGRGLLLALGVTLAAPARADVAEVLDGHILPGIAAFADAAGTLAATAAADCARETVLPAYQATFDAWVTVADIRLGPQEQAALTIAFWPDERGSGARTLAQLLATDAPALSDPAAFAQQSAAARGLFALDLLLADPAFAYAPGDPGCTLVQTVTTDLAAQARTLAEGWGFQADLLRNPGGAENVTYLDAAEARTTLYTQIVTGLTVTTDSRLARPLGTLDRPRPTRAEGWRTGRPLPNALASAHAAHAMATLLAGQPLPLSDAALAQVDRAAAAIADPAFQDIADPGAWLKLDILRQRIAALRVAIETEIEALAGLTPGFNATDGD